MAKNLEQRRIDADIAKLAIPSLGTLLAEPLLVAVDTTMVGRLGTAPLAGLSLAATILTTLVGICIFLSYATTAATARYVGAGKPAVGMRYGLDGMWLALGLGAILALILEIFAPEIIALFQPEPAVAQQAIRYARASAPGLPGMLLILAANGTLRGFADARTPLVAATAGALANIPLNAILIYGCQLGIVGAGTGTAIAQTGVGIFLTVVVVRRARKLAVPLRPSGSGVLRAVREAVPLIIRTLSLRGAILLHITAATSLGTFALAANQIIMTVWNFAAYGLDSLATAAQILVGQGLGAQNRERVRTVLRRCLIWGARVGIGLGVLVAAAAPLISTLMVTDPPVRELATHTMWLVAVAFPLAAIAYMLDGVLIGAADTRALAWYMIGALLAFTPVALFFTTAGADWGETGLLLLWAGYVFVFMGVRAGTMLWRIRGDRWMRLTQQQLTERSDDVR
ncbi:MAG: MATE family efflux transporter [Trueperella sp.]|nr:MATE family efflux transporter [Trueperella sp.]